MSDKRGFTLIEVIVSLALLGIIALGFLTALSGNFSFLLGTKDITEDVFLAQKTLEAEIESVKADLDSGVTPAGAKSDYTLFDEVYSGAYQITVSGYPRETAIAGSREIATVIAESRMPVFIVPVANSSNLVLRLSGTTLPDNFEYVNLANLSLRANSSVTENGVFLVNKHEWYVSRAGFNIPMVSWGLVDKDFDLGRLYPLFPNDYIPVPIKSNSDQLSQSDFNNLLNNYAGKHIIYTITPYAISGKKGATIFSNPVFLVGPTVRDGLVLHLDASLVSKEDASSVIEVGSDMYVKQWKNIISDVNNAVQVNPSSRPELMEVQYPEDLFVWGKSMGGTGADMAINSFNPSDADELTVFIVAKSDALNSPGTEIIKGGSGSDAWSFGWGDGENLVFTGDTPAFLDEHEGLDGGWHIFTLVAADDVLNIRMDGQGVTADHDGTYSGSLELSPFNINWDDIEISEILVYERDLSFDAGTDMLAVETYLQTKYDPDPDDINISIVFLKPLAPVTVYQNQAFVLPSTAKALMSNGMTYNVDVTWWPDIIETSETGTQLSVATAVMDNTKTVVLTVNVVAIDHFIEPDPITAEHGRPYPLPVTLPAVYLDGETRETEVTWSGTVELLDIGEHTLTATSVLDPTKTVDLQVTVIAVAVTGVDLSPATLTLVRTNTDDLTATVQPADAANKNVTWSSSNPSVATVNASNGHVTALIPGTAVITVTTEEGGFTDTCDVTVIPIPVVSVDLNKSTTSLVVGGSETLIATVLPSSADNKSVTWDSSNPSIATVNAGGTVIAVGPGSATITVRTVDGGLTDTCIVAVIRPVTGVTLTPESVTMNIGNTQTLTATVLPADATNKNVTWLSSNDSIATVSPGGVVTAMAAGSAVITVTTVDGGFTDTCNVTVRARPIALSISDGYADKFTLTFDKNIQDISTSPDYADAITISGVNVTFDRNWPRNYPETNITVNVTAADGSTNTVVVRRSGTDWSIVSQL